MDKSAHLPPPPPSSPPPPSNGYKTSWQQQIPKEKQNKRERHFLLVTCEALDDFIWIEKWLVALTAPLNSNNNSNNNNNNSNFLTGEKCCDQKANGLKLSVARCRCRSRKNAYVYMITEKLKEKLV